MKKLRLTITLLILIVAGAITASAQGPGKPIRWSVNVKMTSATAGELIVRATVDDGWHLYGTSLPKGGPKPTVIDFAASKGVKFTSEFTPSVAPVKVHDSMFDVDLTWWKSTVVFRRSFKVTDSKNAKIEGSVTFMGCNDQTCLPPSTEKFSKPVVVKK